jgi:hypothetical protein
MSLSGFSVNGVCALDANSAMQTLALPYPLIAQSTLYSIQNIAAASAPTFTFTLLESPLPSGTPTTNNFSVQLVPCDPTVSTTPYFDGMQMGWGVVAAMAVSASIIYIKHSFFR